MVELMEVAMESLWELMLFRVGFDVELILFRVESFLAGIND